MRSAFSVPGCWVGEWVCTAAACGAANRSAADECRRCGAPRWLAGVPVCRVTVPEVAAAGGLLAAPVLCIPNLPPPPPSKPSTAPSLPAFPYAYDTGTALLPQGAGWCRVPSRTLVLRHVPPEIPASEVTLLLQYIPHGAAAL